MRRRRLPTWALFALLPCSVAGSEEAVPEVESTPGITLLDGTDLPGRVTRITDDGVVAAGRNDVIALYELQEIRFRAPARQAEDDRGHFDRGPLIRFRGGEDLTGRVMTADSDAALVRPAHLPELSVPLEAMSAFRLREANLQDDLFEKDLDGEPPRQDTVYVRGASLLRVEGTFRGMTKDYLRLERRGKIRRLKRNLVQGVIFAPLASGNPEADPPATINLAAGGRLPIYLAAIEPGDEGTLSVRLPGADAGTLQELPLAAVRSVTFASDRVVFLSSLEPSSVEETPVLGRAFPYRKDRSVGGSPLRLAGRLYRRGLGVHSRSVLEYALDGRYRSFAATIGLDDASNARGSVTFRVLADGKELFSAAVAGRDAPQTVSLPMTDVERLRLVVDYGADDMDIADHADWANARLVK